MTKRPEPCACPRLKFPHRFDKHCAELADDMKREQWERTATPAEYWADVDRDEKENT